MVMGDDGDRSCLGKESGMREKQSTEKENGQFSICFHPRNATKCMYPTIIPLPVCLLGTVLVVESQSMRNWHLTKEVF